MGHPGAYLYCIIPCREKRVFAEVTPIGDAMGPVYAVHQNGLAAVVSDTAATTYQSTRGNLLAHERVVERVMQEYPLLPMRFGTVADSQTPAEAVQKLLARRATEFHGLLGEMEGKVELGLKAFWRDEKGLFEEIVTGDAAIRGLRDSLKGKPPQATHFDRIRLGEMVKQTLERRRSDEAQGLLAPLRRLAVRTVENQTIVDRMIANAAFLVAREREEAFDRAVARLDEEHGQKVLFRYVGPVPPYNFVTIVVNWQEVWEREAPLGPP